MKSILKFAACAFLLEIAIFVSCKKDQTKDNHFPPVAIAGADKHLALASCDSPGFIDVDGSGSSDADNNISSYRWRIISGSSTATLWNSTSSVARLGNLAAGQYALELTVTDAEGLWSQDTVLINVEGPEYDLDEAIFNSFIYYDNYADCYYGPPCFYYDLTTIQGSFNFPPIGQFSLYASEYADTAFGGDSPGVTMRLYAGNGNGANVWGTCSVNFKQLIEKGGGSFSGTFKVNGGSSQTCSQSIYDNLAPLSVTGNLDVAAHTITMNIKGKTYF